MADGYNDKIRQVLLLTVIIALAFLLFKELYAFFPGFLGAITWYILCRNFYYFLTEKKGWNRAATATLFLAARSRKRAAISRTPDRRT